MLILMWATNFHFRMVKTLQRVSDGITPQRNQQSDRETQQFEGLTVPGKADRSLQVGVVALVIAARFEAKLMSFVPCFFLPILDGILVILMGFGPKNWDFHGIYSNDFFN